MEPQTPQPSAASTNEKLQDYDKTRINLGRLDSFATLPEFPKGATMTIQVGNGPVVTFKANPQR